MATAEQLRRARERQSIFSGIYDAARQNAAELQAQGRRPVWGGLLSKEPVRGTDTVRWEGNVAGLLEPMARAIDAPISAMRGLLPQEDIPMEAMGTAGLAATGALGATAKSAATYDPSTVRIFAGANAKTADLDALKKARELSARRRSPQEIWDETGWFKGADGKWRFEIDDSKAILRQKAADALNYGGPEYQTNYSGGLLHQQLLGGHYRGQELPAAYPNMFGDMDFSQRPRQSGSFDLDTGQIRVSSPDAREGLPVALHELQHAVQAQEGFAPGSNPSFELNELLTSRMNETRRISNEIDKKKAELGLSGYRPKHPELEPLYAEYDRAVNRAISDEEAYQQYIRTAGEVEANNVMKRRTMTAEQRRATPPWETQDFPYDEQIVRTREARRGLLD